jgi:hypothetical protein
MDRTSPARLVASGLAAGALLNLGEFLLNGVLLRGEWDAAMRSLSLPPIGGRAILLLNLLGFALGVAMMALYAVARPRFSRARAVTMAALLAWVLGYALGFGWSYALGVFSRTLYWATLAWSLPELLLVAAAGGWLLERGRAARRA